MASRKQRRRRAKETRHEYEYVYVDSDGREVEVDGEDPAPAAPAKARGEKTTAKAARNGPAKGAAKRQPAGRGATRKVEPPSWKRVARRGLIFGPLMFVVVSLMGRNVSVAGHFLQTAFLLAFFLPFSYVMDSIMYRTYVRRTGGGDAGAKSGKRR